MPTSSAISTDDKAKIKAAIPSSSNKILTAALARVYYAYPDPKQWSYTGLQGAIALAKDNTRNAHFFRLVDLVGTRGVIWEHELYEGFEYHEDRSFFFSFPGDVSCSISTFILRWSRPSRYRRGHAHTELAVYLVLLSRDASCHGLRASTSQNVALLTLLHFRNA